MRSIATIDTTTDEQAVTIKFGGSTDGFILPRVKVFDGKNQLYFGIEPIVVPGKSTGISELRFPEKDRYNADPLWRCVKRLLTESVFLPSVGSDIYPATVFQDYQFHKHVHFYRYDFT